MNAPRAFRQSIPSDTADVVPNVDRSYERRFSAPTPAWSMLYRSFGSAYCTSGGGATPPSAGKNAIFWWNSPPAWSVSLPTHNPSAVTGRVKLPMPRSRPGFQLNGMPFHRRQSPDTFARNGAGACHVAAVGVVHPAHVSTHVHGGAADAHAPRSVASRPVRPSRDLAGPGGVEFEPGDGVAQAVRARTAPVVTTTKY